MPDGTCRTLKMQYFKTFLANLLRSGSMAATGVIEYEEDIEDTAGNEAGMDRG